MTTSESRRAIAGIMLAVLSPVYAQESPETNPSSSPAHLTAVGDTLFFAADDGIHGRELWLYRPAGAASGAPMECRLAGDIVPGLASANIASMTDCGGWLYFIAETPEAGRELWFWDPDSQQPRMVQDLLPGPATSAPNCPAFIRGFVLFCAADTGGKKLWRTRPGETSATALIDTKKIVLELRSGGPAFGVTRDQMYFLPAVGRTLWRSDGTPMGTACVEQVSAADQDFLSASIGPNRLLFFGADLEYGVEPWITDGTTEGTALLKDIMPGNVPATNGQMRSMGDRVFFGGDDSDHGIELWKTDGTSEGTVLVKDIDPGRASSDPHYFTVCGTWLYFAASDNAHGLELWRSDGTEENTTLVADINPGPPGTDVWAPCAYKNKFFFCAKSPLYGEEVFMTDGTPDSLDILRDIVSGAEPSGPDNLCVLGDTLFFTSDDGLHGEELWMSDGTAAGTRLAADIALPRGNPSSSPRQLTALGSHVFFTVNDVDHGEELWSSDGTEQGTRVVKDIAAGLDSSAPRNLTVLDQWLFFTARDDASGNELWMTGGTENDTRLVRDIRPGKESSNPAYLIPCAGKLYFAANDGTRGNQLWCTDGTEQGTISLEDAGSAPIVEVFSLWNRVYFYRGKPGVALTLWHGDGIGAGTHALGAVPLTLSFEEIGALTAASDEQRLVPFIHPCGENDPKTKPASFDGNLYFAGRSQQQGTELWRTDGTIDGTHQAGDLYPGSASSCPTHLTVVQDTLYFIAEHPREGRCLWRKNDDSGQAEVVRPNMGGVRIFAISATDLLLANEERGWLLIVTPGAIASTPGFDTIAIVGHLASGDDYSTHFSYRVSRDYRRFLELTRAEDQVFFTFDDEIHGEELWVISMKERQQKKDVGHLVKDILAPADLRALRN